MANIKNRGRTYSGGTIASRRIEVRENKVRRIYGKCFRDLSIKKSE